MLKRALFAATLFSQSPLYASTVPGPDLILRNGEIYLVEPEGKWAEAIAVKDGKIVALGTNAAIDKLKGSTTKVIDLAGRMAMPGIVDSHVHVGSAASEIRLYTCVISGYAGFDEVLTAVAGCAKGRQAGEWIVGQYWSSALYERLGQEDAIKQLDAVSAGHPVMLRNDTIHDRWANSRALELAGITKDTPNPVNGKIGRDPNTGALNGLLLETAGALVEQKIPMANEIATVEAGADALAVGVNYLNSKGVTAFNDAVVFEGASDGEGKKTNFSNVAAYHLLDTQGRLSAHAALSMLIDPSKPRLDQLFSRRNEVRSNNLSMDFAKIFVDGVMVSHTGVFLDPYLPDKAHGANFRGEPKMTQATLSQLVTELDKRKISVKMHVAGDGSVRMALDAIANARKANGTAGPLHTLAHGGFIAPGDVDRLKPLNTAIDASPTVWYPGPIQTGTEAVLGKERADGYWPMKTITAKGGMIAGGTDWKTLPGEFSDLWSGMQGMVTRRNPSGAAPGVLGPEEAVDVATMIRFYTLNSAKALQISDRAGSLKIGKQADLIVLGQNLFKIPNDKIASTQVDMTIYGGKIVYARASSTRPEQ